MIGLSQVRVNKKNGSIPSEREHVVDNNSDLHAYAVVENVVEQRDQFRATSLDLGVIPDRMFAGPHLVCVVNPLTALGSEICSENNQTRSLANYRLAIDGRIRIFRDLGLGHG